MTPIPKSTSKSPSDPSLAADAQRVSVVLVAGVGTPDGQVADVVAGRGVIGLNGGLPWHAPDDLRFFKRVTMGTVLVMGRRTFDAIGKPLPGRTNVVVTRDGAALTAAFPGVIARETLAQAMDAARDVCARDQLTTISVAGGGVVYAGALLLADELLLTFHDYAGAGDVYFPPFDPSAWSEVSREAVGAATAVRYRRVRGSRAG